MKRISLYLASILMIICCSVPDKKGSNNIALDVADVDSVLKESGASEVDLIQDFTQSEIAPKDSVRIDKKPDSEKCAKFKDQAIQYWVSSPEGQSNKWKSGFREFEDFLTAGACMKGESMNQVKKILGNNFVVIPSRGEHLKYYPLEFIESTVLDAPPLNSIEEIAVRVICEKGNGIVEQITYSASSKPIKEKPEH